VRVPHFITLAQIDRAHFITACRHGVVHLTWGRTTVRFSHSQFEKLVGLVQYVADGPPPASAHDEELWVTSRLEEDSELRVGSTVILLSPSEWQAFSRAMRSAAQHLSDVLASGAWDDPEDRVDREEQQAPSNPLLQLRETRFSDN
jgi:hypothetical protein